MGNSEWDVNMASICGGFIIVYVCALLENFLKEKKHNPFLWEKNTIFYNVKSQKVDLGHWNLRLITRLVVIVCMKKTLEHARLTVLNVIV